jgi:hypothetical protein
MHSPTRGILRATSRQDVAEWNSLETNRFRLPTHLDGGAPRQQEQSADAVGRLLTAVNEPYTVRAVESAQGHRSVTIEPGCRLPLRTFVADCLAVIQKFQSFSYGAPIALLTTDSCGKSAWPE